MWNAGSWICTPGSANSIASIDVSGAPYRNIAELAGDSRSVAFHRNRFDAVAGVLCPCRFRRPCAGCRAAPFHQQHRSVCALDGGEPTRGGGARAAVVGIAPHSLRAATPDELAAMMPLAATVDHIHVAEQTREVDDCVAWSGQRPVQWLLDHAPVDQRLLSTIQRARTPDELRGMAARASLAEACPITEANLGDGISACGLRSHQALGMAWSDSMYAIQRGKRCQLEYSSAWRIARAQCRDRACLGVDAAHPVRWRACPAVRRRSGLLRPGLWPEFYRHRQPRCRTPSSLCPTGLDRDDRRSTRGWILRRTGLRWWMHVWTCRLVKVTKQPGTHDGAANAGAQ